MTRTLFETQDGDEDEVRSPIPVDHTPWLLDVQRCVVTDLAGEVQHGPTRVLEDVVGQRLTVSGLRLVGRRLQALHAGVSWHDFSAVQEVLET